MNANLTKEVNGKPVFCLPQNIIYYLPHNKQQLTNEMVVRLVLTIPEPEEGLSNEEKIKYHKEKNKKFVEKYKEQWNDLLFTDISHIDSEVWLGFKTFSNDIINNLTELEEVCCIYVYNQPRTKATLTSSFYEASIQNVITNELSKKLETKTAPENKNKVKEILENIGIDSSYYDPKTKTLTLSFIHYKTPEEVEQLFAYLYIKKDNCNEIINKLAGSILTNLYPHKDKQIARINFVIEDNNWPKNSPNRYFHLFPREVLNLETKEYQTKYLNSTAIISKNTNQSDIVEMIKIALNYYSDLFKAISTKPLDILELISKLDPEQVKLEDIKKQNSNNKTLYIKFSIFNTQEKMNLLYAYLATEPYNKTQWIQHLKNLIVQGLKDNNLGNIKAYHFITFDSLYYVSKVTNFQASIGGIDLNKSYYDLDNDNNEIKELFLDLKANFNNEEELEIYINRNIQWNRHIYLSYYFKESIFFNFGEKVKRSISSEEISKSYWNNFNNLKSSLKPNFSLNNETLTINLSGFKNLEEFKILLYLINNDNDSDNRRTWATKLASIVSEGLNSNKEKIKNIKSICIKVEENISNESLFFDLATKSYNDVIKELANKNLEALKLIIFINLNRINSDLILAAINAGIVASGLEDKDYAMQYMAVGLGSFFNSLKAKKINFNDKKNRIGILEAHNGIVLPLDPILHFSSDRLITNTEDGQISSHASLVGNIVGSLTQGVDKTSTIVSAGFEYAGENSKTSWNALKAIEWLVEQNIKLLNCSWGLSKKYATDPDFVTYSDLAYKLDYITRKFGIVVFKSTGNDHDQYKTYLRAASLAFNIISVGSTNSTGHKLSVFSDYEKLQTYEMTREAPKPLLVAPGEAYKYKNRYFDGTSFATPLVTGTTSLLMKEYSEKLEGKPAAVMAVLAASSDDRYNGTMNKNGLKYETGAGLLNYNAARSAAENVVNLEVENNLKLNHTIQPSSVFNVLKGQTISVGTAVLYNGGYVTSIDLPNLKPTRGGISSVPIIGYLYLAYAYIYNNHLTSKFKNQFKDSNGKMLKMEESINVNNLDTYLMPINVTATLEKYDTTTGKWTEVNWNNKVDSHYSNIKKFVYTNNEATNKFRYEIKVCREGKHVSGDHTKNILAFTHVIKN